MSDYSPLPDAFFRTLDATEEEQFREYARTHDPRDIQQWMVSHPVCRDEWEKLGKTPKEAR